MDAQMDVYPDRSFDVRVSSDGARMILVKNLNAFELDDVGTSVWNACDGRHTVEEIALRIAAEYDVELEVARADVTEFVSGLRAAKLLDC